MTMSEMMDHSASRAMTTFLAVPEDLEGSAMRRAEAKMERMEEDEEEELLSGPADRPTVAHPETHSCEAAPRLGFKRLSRYNQRDRTPVFSLRTMECERLCVILMFLCAVCWEQHVATMPSSTLHVRVGENVTLQCPLLKMTTNTSSTTEAPHDPSRTMLSWYRRSEGQVPQMLLSIGSSNSSLVKYGSGVSPDKVRIAEDGSLRLHVSKLSDAAFYYCSISQGMENKDGPLN